MTAAAHTPVPWQVVVEPHILSDGSWADSTSIHTAYDHGQLHGPAPVVGLAYSNDFGHKPLTTLYITPENAAFIVEACNSHASLLAERDALVRALEAAEQCIGELSPTQARVEAMQMIQAALKSARGAA